MIMRLRSSTRATIRRIEPDEAASLDPLVDRGIVVDSRTRLKAMAEAASARRSADGIADIGGCDSRESLNLMATL